jgi:3-oxoacyl-[acyl-carrier protein] reductase
MQPVMLITGTRKGIGFYLAKYYLARGWLVIGCSRGESTISHENYSHRSLDVANEQEVVDFFISIDKEFDQLNVLINNAGIASMNHALLTPGYTVSNIFNTNVLGTFLFCREAAKLMMRQIPQGGRIINMSSVAVPLKIEGEAVYAASKAAVNSLTQVLAREFSHMGVTVNAVGATPILTDLIKNVPEIKMNLIRGQIPLNRFGNMEDISNVCDFFIQPASDYITGQIIYLGGVS